MQCLVGQGWSYHIVNILLQYVSAGVYPRWWSRFCQCKPLLNAESQIYASCFGRDLNLILARDIGASKLCEVDLLQNRWWEISCCLVQRLMVNKVIIDIWILRHDYLNMNISTVSAQSWGWINLKRAKFSFPSDYNGWWGRLPATTSTTHLSVSHHLMVSQPKESRCVVPAARSEYVGGIFVCACITYIVSTVRSTYCAYWTAFKV